MASSEGVELQDRIQIRLYGPDGKLKVSKDSKKPKGRISKLSSFINKVMEARPKT